MHDDTKAKVAWAGIRIPAYAIFPTHYCAGGYATVTVGLQLPPGPLLPLMSQWNRTFRGSVVSVLWKPGPAGLPEPPLIWAPSALK